MRHDKKKKNNNEYRTVKQCNSVNYSHPMLETVQMFSVGLFFQHYLLDPRITYTVPLKIENVLCLHVYLVFLDNTPHVEGGRLMEGLFECEERSTVDVQNGPDGVILICFPSVYVLLS